MVDKADGSGMDIFFNVEAVLRSIRLFENKGLSDILVINKKFEGVLGECAREAQDSGNEKVTRMIRKADKMIDDMESWQ